MASPPKKPAAGTDVAHTTASLLEEHRAALTGHCYRMLGSAAEADDAVQETMLRAWRNLDQFEGRASMRTWLYRIATHVCLDLLGDRTRPVELSPVGTIHDELTLLPGSRWIEPIPDALALPADADPAELLVLRQSIRLAFVAALQHMPPRQRAALLLTEVPRLAGRRGRREPRQAEETASPPPPSHWATRARTALNDLAPLADRRMGITHRGRRPCSPRRGRRSPMRPPPPAHASPRPPPPIPGARSDGRRCRLPRQPVPGPSAFARHRRAHVSRSSASPRLARLGHAASSRVEWAVLLRRTYGVDALRCPTCSGRMRVTATITEPATVKKILAHLGLPTEPLPRARARDPTGQESFDFDAA